jgi:hypothetical protein
MNAIGPPLVSLGPDDQAELKEMGRAGAAEGVPGLTEHGAP